MSEPINGHDPERPADQQDVAGTDQPTEPVGPANPTEPIHSGQPDTTAEPDYFAGGPRTPIGDVPESAWQQTPGDSPAEPYGAMPVPDEPRGVPLGTLVFGLVVVALGLLILVSVFYDITLSGSAVAIALFLGAGLVLIIGGLVAARRSSANASSGS
ncbi:TIGR04086 family membrane protein [Micrococcaceae bacterium RIT802]|jgi:hypothetical protein|nr:TIGR04086 family membrane protein [Micrococcaceae bacterium RIT 802]